MKVNVEIPSSAIEEVVSKDLVKLKRENQKLANQVANLQQQLSRDQAVYKQAKAILNAIKETGDFHELGDPDCGYGD